jgi:hypothetical protein
MIKGKYETLLPCCFLSVLLPATIQHSAALQASNNMMSLISHAHTSSIASHKNLHISVRVVKD